MRNIGLRAALIAAAAMGLAAGPSVTITNEKAINSEAPQPARKVKKQKAPQPMAWGRSSTLNRSRHWRYAKTYADARAISPFPERVVR
jgi:hypothetical protein